MLPGGLIAVSTDICAIYTIVSDENSVRIRVFLESDPASTNRELLRYQVTQFLDEKLPAQIIHFEFHVLDNARPPFDVEPGGFWVYAHPGVGFSGGLQLFPASDNFIQQWRERIAKD